jgi:hypothetical protein
MAPTQNAFPITNPQPPPRIEYVFLESHVDDSEISKLKTQLKAVERERDMWRNRALRKAK